MSGAVRFCVCPGHSPDRASIRDRGRQPELASVGHLKWVRKHQAQHGGQHRGRGAVYEACRRMGHAWDQLDGPPVGYEGLVRDVYLRCIRCATLRAFDLSPTGEVMWVRYIYPEGYQWTGRRGEAPTKADHRIAWLRDIIASRKGR